MLFKIKSAICKLYHGGNKLCFNEMMWMMMMTMAMFRLY